MLNLYIYLKLGRSIDRSYADQLHNLTCSIIKLCTPYVSLSRRTFESAVYVDYGNPLKGDRSVDVIGDKTSNSQDLMLHLQSHQISLDLII